MLAPGNATAAARQKRPQVSQMPVLRPQKPARRASGTVASRVPRNAASHTTARVGTGSA